jgi:hypothetical protein
MQRTALAIVALILVALSAGAADATRWINVDVTEADSNTKVKVHLPLDLVLTAIDGIKVDRFDRGKVKLEMDDADIDWVGIFNAIKGSPDGEFVTVESDDAHVQVTKKGGSILIHVTETGDDNAVVDVKLPVELMDTLSVDEENRLDVRAVIASLAALPDGELVRVTSDEANVRIWIE